MTEEIKPTDVEKAEDVIKPGEAPPTPPDESPGLAFKLTPRKRKPTRKYRKGSKYDPLLEAFMKGKDRLVEISVSGKEANYMRTQLNKRLAPLKLDKSVTISVVNNVLYLEKITQENK